MNLVRYSPGAAELSITPKRGVVTKISVPEAPTSA